MSVTAADIDKAAARLAGRIVRTPLLESPELNALSGGRVLLKAENLQRGGSFKLRGAMSRLTKMNADERARGVVAFSSGNHAQGVALAARDLGMQAAIVMPADAPEIKRRRTAEFGAEVILYDRYRESREAIAARLAAERGATLVPAFDDPDVIAGQGTAGLEIAEQAEELDAVLICCSGGGLAAGVGLAVRRRFPGARVCTVEPEACDDMARSLVSGRRESNAPAARTICDALMVPSPGELTLPILLSLGAKGLTVSDAEAAQAQRFAFESLKLVLEPGGAAALAAVLAGKLDLRGKTAAVLLSGGNVDAAAFAGTIAAA